MKSKKKPEPFTGEGPLKERQLSKHKKPKFKRQESWRYKRVKENWRKPCGIDSKMRKKVKGWPPSPEVGYRSPKKIRGLHPSGYVEVRVQTVEDLNGLDPKTQAIRIARTVGGKKRVEILALADERGIHVLNPRIAKELEEIEEEEVEEEEEEKEGEKEKEKTK
ncbi:MAG: 50S ribosomal protein L32e [Candidatus Bathyarchaeota archaeon]|nr:50S ribosomal protein L32e [Candidatus Bathyarchaeota archaeon]